MTIRIAWATPDDADALAPLLRALYAHDAPEVPPPTDDVASAHLALLLSPDAPHRLAIAWSDDGRAVGLAAVAVFVSVSDPRPERWRQMDLNELFVAAEHRNGGVGAALTAWIEADARAQGAGRIDWHVARGNQRGRAFYERWGAHAVEERLSMRKSLTEGAE